MKRALVALGIARFDLVLFVLVVCTAPVIPWMGMLFLLDAVSTFRNMPDELSLEADHRHRIAALVNAGRLRIASDLANAPCCVCRADPGGQFMRSILQIT